MRYKVVLSQNADRDIRGIYEYIMFSLKAPAAVANILDKLESGIFSLDEMPKRYKLISHQPWSSRNARIMTVENYVVIYCVDEDNHIVSILRVMYGGRDIDAEFEK